MNLILVYSSITFEMRTKAKYFYKLAKRLGCKPERSYKFSLKVSTSLQMLNREFLFSELIMFHFIPAYTKLARETGHRVSVINYQRRNIMSWNAPLPKPII